MPIYARADPLESSIERNTVKRALDMGVRSIKLNVKGETGWPDRLFLIPGGRPLFIEFKRYDLKPRKKQIYMHQVLSNLNYDVVVCDHVTEAIEAIAGALEAARVPKKGDPVPAKARRRSAVSRSRLGEDIDPSCVY
jgi:uncharacterized protein YyaL (SSP411 family)